MDILELEGEIESFCDKIKEWVVLYSIINLVFVDFLNILRVLYLDLFKDFRIFLWIEILYDIKKNVVGSFIILELKKGLLICCM